MNIYEALYTTRSMRRLVRIRFPTRSRRASSTPQSGRRAAATASCGASSWSTTRRSGRSWRCSTAQVWKALWAGAYAERTPAPAATPTRLSAPRSPRLVGSAQHLADHWQEVPLFLFGFTRADAGGSSIYPALWSAMLAARAEGVGSTLTTVLGVYRAAETLALLGVPADGGWTMAGCVTLGYPTGRWGVAARLPSTRSPPATAGMAPSASRSPSRSGLSQKRRCRPDAARCELEGGSSLS